MSLQEGFEKRMRGRPESGPRVLGGRTLQAPWAVSAKAPGQVPPGRRAETAERRGAGGHRATVSTSACPPNGRGALGILHTGGHHVTSPEKSSAGQTSGRRGRNRTPVRSRVQQPRRVGDFRSVLKVKGQDLLKSLGYWGTHKGSGRSGIGALGLRNEGRKLPAGAAGRPWREQAGRPVDMVRCCQTPA